MWTLISSAGDIKKGMELLRSHDANTGKVFKVIDVSENFMYLITLKFITSKGEFYNTSLNSQVLTYEKSKVPQGEFYYNN